MPRVSVSRFALHAGLVTFRQTFVLRCLGGKLPPAGGKSDFCRHELPVRARLRPAPPMPTQCTFRSGPDAHDLPLIAWRGFLARSRIARCEVGYNREKVLLVESGYNSDHQRAPFSRSSAVPEVIELPEHVAR